MTLLAIDPGRAVKPSIGWCLFNDQGVEQGRGIVTFEYLMHVLGVSWFEPGETPELVWSETGFSQWPTEVVIEDFINNPKSRGGQHNGTSECIGAVEALCIVTNTPFTRQPSSILGPAKLLADYQGTLQHLPDQDSAYLHGYYYLVGKGVLKSKGLADTL